MHENDRINGVSFNWQFEANSHSCTQSDNEQRALPYSLLKQNQIKKYRLEKG